VLAQSGALVAPVERPPPDCAYEGSNSSIPRVSTRPPVRARRLNFRSGSVATMLHLDLTGQKLKMLAFPDRKFASEIEYDGRRSRFHSTELLSGPGDDKPKWKRLVYTEIPAPSEATNGGSRCRMSTTRSYTSTKPSARVKASRSQSMDALLASCINSEADEATLKKITAVLQDQLARHKAGEIVSDVAASASMYLSRTSNEIA
jgi:hypothetical protein